jgi:hypothetical protein
MISEIFPLKVRSAAMSVSTVANWASNFLVAPFFLTLTGAITIQGTFWLYAGFGVAAVIFFALRLPETKDRSLEEISHEVTEEGGVKLSRPAEPAGQRRSEPAYEIENRHAVLGISAEAARRAYDEALRAAGFDPITTEVEPAGAFY